MHRVFGVFETACQYVMFFGDLLRNLQQNCLIPCLSSLLQTTSTVEMCEGAWNTWRLKRHLKNRGIFLGSSFPFLLKRSSSDLFLSEFRSDLALNGKIPIDFSSSWVEKERYSLDVVDYSEAYWLDFNYLCVLSKAVEPIDTQTYYSSLHYWGRQIN